MSPKLMRFRFLLLFVTCGCSPLCVSAQTPRLEVSADIIIPQPPPTTPSSAWVDAPGRKAISMDADGVRLRGFRYAGSNPSAPEVLFFNGNGMTVLRTDSFYRTLAKQGPTVTVYDYRGFGFSSGEAHLESFRSDGLRAYDALVKEVKSGKVIVYGASMGTATAAYIASRRPLAGLILGMPIASAEEELPVYGRLMGFSAEQLAAVSITPDARDVFGETSLLKKSQAPLLVLGGENDRVVPVQQAREVFEASPAPAKKFLQVPGAGHNGVIISPAALAAVNSFVAGLR